MTRRLAREEGLLVGGSCGMAVVAALRVAGARRRRRRGRRAAAGRRPRLPVEDLQRRLDGRLRLPAHDQAGDRGRRAAARRRRACRSWCTCTRRDGRDAIDILREYGVSQMPVVKAEPPVVTAEVVGSIVERDLLDALFTGHAPAGRPARAAHVPAAADDRRRRAGRRGGRPRWRRPTPRSCWSTASRPACSPGRTCSLTCPGSTQVGSPPDSVVNGVTREAAVTEQDAGPTVADWLRRNVAECGDEVALRRMRPDGTGLEEWTWAEVGDRSARLAAAFTRLGLGRGERMLLFLRNRPEFHVADLGALLAGGTPLSIYNSSAPEQVAQLAGHSRSRIAVVEDIEFLERLLKVRDELPDLRAIVVVDDPDGAAPAGRAAARRPLRRRPGRPRGRGRRGPARGPGHGHLHLRHDRAAQGRDARPTPTSGRSALGYMALVGPTPDRRTVSYLPMAHVAERMVTHYGWLWQRTDGHLLPGPEHSGRIPGPGPADRPVRSAAGVREAQGRHRGRGRGGRTGEGGRVRAGQGGRPADRRAARGRPAAAAGAGGGLGAARRGRVRADPPQRRARPAQLLLLRRGPAAGRRHALPALDRPPVLRGVRDEREHRRR